uniref:Uncharacterized protein n=1 Tax=Anguilla anguilla TaxID=7936 RepID=A0A0E9U3K7_ANGAN
MTKLKKIEDTMHLVWTASYKHFNINMYACNVIAYLR